MEVVGNKFKVGDCILVLDNNKVLDFGTIIDQQDFAVVIKTPTDRVENWCTDVCCGFKFIKTTKYFKRLYKLDEK